MSGLMDILSQSIGQEHIASIAKQLGATPEQTQQAIALALPTMIGALAKNSESEEGVAQLHQSLEKEHDGSVLDNIGGLLGSLTGGTSGASAQHLSGGGAGGGLGGLLGSILGGRQSKVEQGIGKASGMSAMQVTSLLAMLAPLVMGALGRMQRQSGGQASDLGSTLRKERTQIQNQAGGGLLGGLLDQDGDGDFDMQDMLKFGMKSIFGRK